MRDGIRHTAGRGHGKIVSAAARNAVIVKHHVLATHAVLPVSGIGSPGTGIDPELGGIAAAAVIDDVDYAEALLAIERVGEDLVAGRKCRLNVGQLRYRGVETHGNAEGVDAA